MSIQRRDRTMNDTEKKRYALFRAISRLDDEYFSHVEKLNVLVSSEQAKQIIKSQDMRTFLKLDVRFGQKFSSILREDKNKNCSIFTGARTGAYVYYDNYKKKGYDIISIVKYAAGVEYVEALSFLCRCYGIDVFRWETVRGDITIDELIKSNEQLLWEVIDGNRSLRYAKKLIPTYSAIMELWKKRKNKIGFLNALDVDLQLGSEYLGNFSGIKRTTAIKHLLVLEYLGIITKIDSRSSIKRISPTNTYYIEDISDKGKEIEERLICLHKLCNGNVYQKISRKYIDVK